MEEEKKSVSNTPKVIDTTPKVVQPKPKKTKAWLVVVVVILSLLLLGVSGYIVFTEFLQNQDDEVEVLEDDETEQEDSSTDDQEEEVSDTEEEEEDDGLNTFEGDVLRAELPDGWSVIEYFDGEGTDSLPGTEMVYEGLTALDIVSPDNRQVFTLQAVSGIGFIGCPQYAIFEDDNEAYRFEQESTSDELGETLNTIDYTDTEYEEFEWLGVTFRRVDDKYYYDTQEGTNYFEPPCVEGLLTLEGLYFTDEDGYIYESYFYGPTEDATDADLPTVDMILQSMELI
jgi:hypothetical protein